MAAQYMPKTLAKTLAYILYRAPGEYGLFWDPNGTMPWKELYWALQEDPELRFVRESHLREIGYLGLEAPAVLDGSLLRLKSGFPAPVYPVEENLPARLYYACRRKKLVFIREHGLAASGRPWLILSASKEMAQRIGKRRDPEPLVIEVLARKAASEGLRFFKAGPELYLVESVPLEHLMLPYVREEELIDLTAKKEKKPEKAAAPATPGSYAMDARHFEALYGNKGAPGDKPKKKGGRGPDWKRQSRNERNKRNV